MFLDTSSVPLDSRKSLLTYMKEGMFAPPLLPFSVCSSLTQFLLTPLQRFQLRARLWVKCPKLQDLLESSYYLEQLWGWQICVGTSRRSGRKRKMEQLSMLGNYLPKYFRTLALCITFAASWYIGLLSNATALQTEWTCWILEQDFRWNRSRNSKSNWKAFERDRYALCPFLLLQLSTHSNSFV